MAKGIETYRDKVIDNCSEEDIKTWLQQVLRENDKLRRKLDSQITIADACVFSCLKAGHTLASSKDTARKYMEGRKEFLEGVTNDNS